MGVQPMAKNNPPLSRDIHPDDISGRMFKAALAEAYERTGRNKTRLAELLGMQSRCCMRWLDGMLPPYHKMQEAYYKLVRLPEKK